MAPPCQQRAFGLCPTNLRLDWEAEARGRVQKQRAGENCKQQVVTYLCSCHGYREWAVFTLTVVTAATVRAVFGAAVRCTVAATATVRSRHGYRVFSGGGCQRMYSLVVMAPMASLSGSLVSIYTAA